VAVAQALEDAVPEGDEWGEGALVEAAVALDQPEGQQADGQELLELAQQQGGRKAGAQQGRRKTMYVPLALVSQMKQALRNGRKVEQLLYHTGPKLIKQHRQRAK
jgi:hypothetical protein